MPCNEKAGPCQINNCPKVMRLRKKGFDMLQLCFNGRLGQRPSFADPFLKEVFLGPNFEQFGLELDLSVD